MLTRRAPCPSPQGEGWGEGARPVKVNEAWYDPQTWPAVEHYFQAQKFHDAAYRETIRSAATPKEAKRLGRTRKAPLRDDWEAVKDGIMLRAVKTKFEAHPELRALLLATGEEELIEAAPADYYWGAGRTGRGRNRLGEILMQVRSELRGERGGDCLAPAS